jgi:hypothetical protein
MELKFSRQILEKYLHIKLYQFRPVGAELFNAEEQMDRQT